MSDSQVSGTSDRFCTNCGTQIRPGTEFCVNCGASSVPNQEPTESGSIPSGPSASEQFGSMWGVIAVALPVLILIFGGVFGVFYGSEDTNVAGSQDDTEETSNPEPVPEPEYADTEALTEEEKDYLKLTASVRSRSDELWTGAFELFNECVSVGCSFDYNPDYIVEMDANREESYELVANASQAASPSGYEESHAALVDELEVSEEMIELMAFGEMTQSTYDAMYNELTSYRVESLDAMPEAGERFYAEQQLEN